jgi:putative ABC transport system permease protein
MRVSLFERVYRRLLRVYPAAFHDEYGGEMTRLFRDRCRREGLLRVLFEALPDLIWTAGREHMESVWRDIRYSVRSLLQARVFAAAVILTLALGIGANTAIFSIAHAVLLRPLPFKDPQQLVQVWENNRRRNVPRYGVAPGNFFDWRQRNTVFQETSAFNHLNMNLTGHGEPVRLLGAGVSASLFPLLGVSPALGRGFLEEEGELGRHQVAILAHALWQNRFGSDTAIIGQPVSLNDQSFTVIGVLPADFQLPYMTPGAREGSQPIDVFIPLAMDSKESQHRGTHPLRVFGRMKPGVTLEQAQSEMDALAAQIEKENPESNVGKGVTLVALHEQLVGDFRLALLVLLGAVAAVLLIACSNVANLLLARALARRKEIVIRAALGAGRGRLVRQLLTESLLLAVLGGLAGLSLAYWAVELVRSLAAANISIPRAQEISLNTEVLAYALGVSLLTALVFGLAPAWIACKVNLNDALKQSTRSSTKGALEFRLRGLLVVSQIALATMLLIGAGLLLRSLWQLRSVNPGFRPARILSMELSLPESRYKEPPQVNSFYDRLIERAQALPGVQSFAGAAYLPLSGSSNAWSFQIEGRAPLPPGHYRMAGWRPVTANYFPTMGIALVRGRTFAPGDTADAPPTVIINQAMAREFWPNEDPLGQRLKFGGGPWRTIVGIVEDVHHDRLDSQPVAEMFFPYQQLGFSWRSITLLARAEGEPLGLAASLRSVVRELDSDLPVYNVRTVESMLSASMSRPRWNLLLLVIFAAIAVILASLGLYGVMNYAVSQRVPEIGIRTALGARPADVVRLILKQGAALILLGVLLGLGGAFALSRVMETLVFGITTTDAATFAGAAVLLAAVALTASYLPARRATKVDPLVALRAE